METDEMNFEVWKNVTRSLKNPAKKNSPELLTKRSKLFYSKYTDGRYI